MTFLATTDLDRGPPVTYCRYSLRGGDLDALWAGHGPRPLTELQAEGESNALFQAIRARGVDREIPLTVETLRAVAEGRVRVEAGEAVPFRLVDGGGQPVAGIDLTAEVEAAVALTHS